MSKIATYSLADTPLQLSDRLIGTEAPRPIPSSTPLATKNFSLGELLQLFSSNFPAPGLQGVLDTQNSATQDINLTGTMFVDLIKPVNIEDMLGNIGTPLQILSKGVGGICWIDASLGGTSWGGITGNILNQTDLITYIEENYYPLNSNPAGYITSSSLSDYFKLDQTTPQTVINGVPTFSGGIIGYIKDTGGTLVLDNINKQLVSSGGTQVKFDWDLMKFPTLTTNGFLKVGSGDGTISVDTNTYLTQQEVEEYPNLASFPPTGEVGVIYIALNTGLFYTWNGSTYILSAAPNTGITGGGIINRLPKFTPDGVTVGSSNFSDDGLGGRYNISGTTSYLAFYAGGNNYLRLQRASTNRMEFILGNPGVSQASEITVSNSLGFELNATGVAAYLSLKANNNQGLKVLPTGKLQFTQTPDAGLTSDSILVRDSSGNIKIVAYPTIPPITGYVPYTGATQDVDLGEYQLRAGQVEFDTTPTGTPGVAKLTWNDTDGTLDLGLKGGNVTLQIGQESVIRVVNKTATNISLLEANYQAVRITGAQGNRLKVDLAQATTDPLSAETIGLVTETIPNNQQGFITTSGLIRNINTTGSLQGETWADGDILYLSPTTAGQATNIKPSAPNHLIILGYVVRAHATQGQIFVKVDNGYELNELHNVKITGTPTNNQTLVYNSSLQVWENKNLVIKVISVTLTPGSWSLVGGYYQSTYSNTNIVSTGYINFTPNNASALEVTTSKMLPEITANNGNCIFYSQFPPQSDITGELIINIL